MQWTTSCAVEMLPSNLRLHRVRKADMTVAAVRVTNRRGPDKWITSPRVHSGC
jgi:hypothetical protein